MTVKYEIKQIEYLPGRFCQDNIVILDSTNQFIRLRPNQANNILVHPNYDQVLSAMKPVTLLTKFGCTLSIDSQNPSFPYTLSGYSYDCSDLKNALVFYNIRPDEYFTVPIQDPFNFFVELKRKMYVGPLAA
jgi:hypothetical protein